MEIIHICEQTEETSFNGCPDAASHFRRMDIFEWLLRKGYETVSLFNTVVHPNYEVMIFAIDQGIEDTTEQNTTSFEQAIIYEDVKLIKYLANHGAMKTNGKPIFENIAALIQI